MNKKIKPMFDNILIKPIEEERKLPSGLVLPDSVKEKPQMGKVIAVGDGGTDEHGNIIKMLIKPNDVVVYKQWSGNVIKIDDQVYTVIEQKGILAVII